MGSSRNTRAVHGVLLLDKPAGITSNRALQIVKRLFNASKAGHTGSLDPFATGLLPICFGEATKISAFLLNADKRYTAVARLGQQTSTGDLDGEVVATADIPQLHANDIQAAMLDLTGSIEQVPPMYSAIKQDGTPLYKLAREGKTVEREPRAITIFKFNCLQWRSPDLHFEVLCSKGTYVRTLAEDLALKLGSLAHLRQLTRTTAGSFVNANAVSIERLQELEADKKALDLLLLPLDSGLSHLHRVVLDDDGFKAIFQGQKIAWSGATHTSPVLLYAPDGTCIGIGELTEEGVLAPKRLFPGLVTKNQAG